MNEQSISRKEEHGAFLGHPPQNSDYEELGKKNEKLYALLEESHLLSRAK